MTDVIQVDTEEIEIATDVLVVGGGLTGLTAASEIADAGYKVILVEKDAEFGIQKGPKFIFNLHDEDMALLEALDEKAKTDDNIDIMTQTSLVSAAGLTGDFTVRLSAEGKVVDRKVGSIVVATDFSVTPLTEAYGLHMTENVLTQSKLEEMVASSKETFAGKTVAFFLGFAQEGNPLVMERALRSVLALEASGCEVYVYVNHLKVASDGLEKMYLDGRQKGAVYFKLSEKPDIQENGKTIVFTDPVLRDQMEISTDYVVIEEEIRTDQANETLACLLRIDIGASGFLQEDNVHLFPVRSNREGIFVIGSSREFLGLPWSWTDVDNVALEIKDLLGDGKRIVPRDKAVIDEGKCVICLTCYRCCPHGAIYWDSKAKISPVACQGCGICASECPMDAIQIGGFNDSQIASEINTGIASGNGAPSIVAFCCQNSAYEAGEMAGVFDKSIPEGLRMIKVPCAGKIDLEYIMSALAHGADGVLVMACHTGNCKSVKGNTYAGWRVNDALRMIEEAGLETDRLRFVTLASNMGNEFADVVSEMEAKLKEIGPSPMRQ
jgi:heterodisulfide reductase subunit A-like polyferredoxin/coenzyme F420-reducing hydrogenase delta subunit